ncbi:MAG: DUF2975 domain-containing protein [Candidatus Enterenecus sp.]
MEMKTTSVQKLARVVRVMVIAVFVCNILALILAPAVVYWGNDPLKWVARGVQVKVLFAVWLEGLSKVWSRPYTLMLTLFLLFSGVCTAVILWQAKRVLDSILKEDTFSFANAANMRRAAVCCFAISGAALIRMVWELGHFHSAALLLSYNTLFVPVFLIAGLVCLVMSVLFRQAAELKAENDLTI